MQRYAYQATNAQGEWISSELSATSVAAAVLELEQLGLVLQAIHLISSDKILADSQEAEFHQRLEGCIRQSGEWLPGLSALASELPAGSSRREMLQLLKHVQPDMSADAFLTSRYAGALLPIMTQGLQAEVESQRLHHWLSNFTQQSNLRSQRRRAMLYPAILLFLALMILIANSLFLVPVFKEMFTEFGLPMPAPTQFVIWVSDQLTIYALRTAVVAIASLGVGYLLLRYWRKYAFTNRCLGSWVAGTTSNLSAISAMASTLAELLSIKAPLPTALSIAGKCSQHYYFQQAAEQLSADIHNGLGSNTTAIAKSRLPPLIMHALQDARGGGPNLELLRELARIYSDRTRHRADWIAAGLPTSAILLVGIVVAFVFISLFMPLVSMITALA